MNVPLATCAGGRLAVTLVACALVTSAGAQTSGARASDVDARRMTDAAAAFIETLDAAGRSAVAFPLSGEDRTNWSNVPPYVHQRPGIRVGDLNDAQLLALHGLLRASLSSQGYQKVAGVMRLDDVHRARTLASQPADVSEYNRAVNESFGSPNYFVSIFGRPGRDPRWAWLIQGHHLGASFTVAGDRIGFVPLFLGAGPLEVDRGDYIGWSAISHELDYAADFAQALTPAQLEKALSDEAVPGDVLNSVGSKGSFMRPGRLVARDLAAEQQTLLRRLVEEYVRNANPSAAAAQLEAIAAAGWDNLAIEWRGTLGDRNGEFYYRIQGPRILIECTHQPQHMHSIVRDPANDYGEQWLELTYLEEISAADRFAAAAARRTQ